MKRTNIEIKPLTGLRGVAAIWVSVFHFQYYFNFSPDFYFSFFANSVVQKGYLAVDFFFVLSGFVMALSAQDWDGSHRLKYFLSFIRSRLARIYPLHLLTLLIMAHLSISPAFISQLALVHAWGFHLEPKFNYPSWSVSVEWAAYLLFPFLLMIHRKLWRWPVLLAISVLGASLILFFISQKFKHGSFDLTWEWGWARCLVEFWTGLNLYSVYKFLNFRLGSFKREILFFTVVSGCISLIYFKLNDAFVMPLAALTVLTCALNSKVLKIFLDNSISYFFGKISYSLYMLQVPVAAIFFTLWEKYVGGHQSFWQGTMGMILGYTVLILSSFLTYRYIENPLRRRIAPRNLQFASRDVTSSGKVASIPLLNLFF